MKNILQINLKSRTVITGLTMVVMGIAQIFLPELGIGDPTQMIGTGLGLVFLKS